MFGTSGAYGAPGAARARYRDIDLTSRIEGASPHALIAILFDELGRTLDTMAAALSAGSGATRAGMPERRARATSILLGLEGSLDHATGGELASGLAAVYREARRLIGDALVRNDPKPLVEARRMIGEIADAWTNIG
ncbi:flagellar export chaperone FliS [Sphingomonas sp.]|uniref:flagellar export chaperone FliS n=1 Tax=Sphingomonas sp. TaxID=28214 RepID=UPI003B004FBB